MGRKLAPSKQGAPGAPFKENSASDSGLVAYIY